MYATNDMRKISMTMVIIFAMVAVLLPLCVMLGCGMDLSHMMGSHTGFSFSDACTSAAGSVAQAAIAPGNLQTLIMTLVVALGLVFALALPQPSMRLVRVVAEEPPPPPEDPLGARFIV